MRGSSKAAIVNVELVDAVRPDAPPEPTRRERPPRGNTGALVLLALLGTVLVALWWAAKPEAGEAADSRPIVAPTSTIDVAEDAAATLDPIGDDPGFHRVPAPGNIDLAVPIGQGWVGFGSGSTEVGASVEPSVLHSDDGLTWVPVETDLPPGRMLGLTYDDPTFRTIYQGFRTGIAVFESNDTRTWTEVAGYDFDGFAAQRAAISEFGAAIHAVELAARAPIPRLREIASNLFGIDLDEPVCRVNRLDISSADFQLRACSGALLGTITADQIAETDVIECLVALSNLQTLPSSIFQLLPDGSMVRTAVEPLNNVLSLEPVASGVLLTSYSQLGDLLTSTSSRCGDFVEESASPVETAGAIFSDLFLFPSDGGEPERLRSLQSDSPLVVLPGSEGAFLLDGEGVHHALPGEIEFTLVGEKAVDDRYIAVVAFSDWLYGGTFDEPGVVAFMRRRGTSAEDAIDIPTIEGGSLPLIASDHYVIFQVFANGPELVRVPLDTSP